MDTSIAEVEKMVAEFESATTATETPSVSTGEQPAEIRNKTHWEKKVFAPFLSKMSKLKKKGRDSKSENTASKNNLKTVESQKGVSNPSTPQPPQPLQPPQQTQLQESEEVEVIGPKILSDEQLFIDLSVTVSESLTEPKNSKSSKITATEKGVLNAFRKCLRLPLNSDFAGKGERVLYAAAEIELNNMSIDYYVHVLKELQNLELMYELKLTLSILSQNQMKKLLKDELITVPLGKKILHLSCLN